MTAFFVGAVRLVVGGLPVLALLELVSTAARKPADRHGSRAGKASFDLLSPPVDPSQPGVGPRNGEVG